MNNTFMNGNEMVPGLNNEELAIFNEPEQYKLKLKKDPEVANLTSKINIQDSNSIVQFGAEASANISKTSDTILNSLKSVKAYEAEEMMNAISGVMKKIDLDEITNSNEKGGKKSLLGKLFKTAQDTIDKIFQKYDTVGKELEDICATIGKYEVEMKKANQDLQKMYEGNREYYIVLEKYIAAGELAIEEIDMYIESFNNDLSMDPNEKNFMIQKLNMSRELLEQRIHDLRLAEVLAIQTGPMLSTMMMSNYNLLRQVYTARIVTIPAFKQCLANAIILKRHQIQANSLQDLRNATNELIEKNARMTATQSVNIANMASTGMIDIGALESSYNALKNGIEETKAIYAANKEKRVQDTARLSQLKSELLNDKLLG